MFEISKLKNGLTLITIPLPHLESVTALVAVGTGSRYETKKVNGISHFLEHMFFKGSRKYPTAEIISNLIDGIGAVNNAATHKEWTFYWIKSASKHARLSSDILASQLSESLLQEEEIEREKGVIIEELRMYRDTPQRYVWDLYEQLQFGDTPLGWDIGGDEKTVTSFVRDNFIDYVDSLYAPENMVLVYAGGLPKDLSKIVDQCFLNLPKRSQRKPLPFKRVKQSKSQVNIFYKKTDQANLILGVEGFGRDDKRKYAARLLSIILGEGMSSRLFIQIRERRGLAYHVNASHDTYKDTGAFAAYAGLKLEKVYEGLEIMKAELERVISERVSDDELRKANEMERGRIAIRSESTNFLAEHFGTEFILDRKVESFDEYLKKIEAVSADDIKDVASELFVSSRYNLQMIGPFQSSTKFEHILNG